MRKKKLKYRSFTFRCEYGRDDDLIVKLEGCEENERSEVIRTMLRLGGKLPLPPRPQVVDVATLRSELGKAIDYLIDNLPAVALEGASQSLALKDVNDKGRNIPDF